MSFTNEIMHGKVCLVTGATRGLGQATALALARQGATVVIVARNQKRIDQTLAMISSETGNTRVEGFLADLSSQADVCRVAGEFRSRHAQLDVLVNNVGGTFLTYQASPDGYEITWALNYLNHFLLTHLLLDALKATASKNGEARIVELTSSIYRMSKPHFDQLPDGHKNGGLSLGTVIRGVKAYSISKRAVNTYTAELSRRLQGTGVTINAVTPGLAKSDIAKSNGWPIVLIMGTMNLFALETARGVMPIVRLASDPAMCGKSGRYFYQYKEMPDDPTCLDSQVVSNLWQLSEKMTGLSNGRGH